MRGGARKGAGRKAVTPGEIRVHFSCRISPRTAATIKELKAQGVTIGRIIDKAIENYSAAKFLRDFENEFGDKA